MNALSQIFIALVALLVIQTSVLAATEISPGILYQGGTKLIASDYGVEFDVPQGWQALLPEDSDVLMMEPVGGVARIVISAVTNSSENAIQQLMSESQPLEADSQLIPGGRVTKKGRIFFQSFSVRGSNPQNLAATAYARLGHNKTAFYVMLLEPVNQDKYKTINRSLVDSVRFKQLTSSSVASLDKENWEQQLKGRSLKYLKTEGGLSEEKQIYLCSNYTFSYYENSNYLSSDVYTDFSSASQNQQTGSWKINGNTILLTWEDGSTTNSTLSRQNAQGESGTFVDGQRWFQVENSVCR